MESDGGDYRSNMADSASSELASIGNYGVRQGDVSDLELVKLQTQLSEEGGILAFIDESEKHYRRDDVNETEDMDDKTRAKVRRDAEVARYK